MAIGITTKHIPATDYKPARIKARTSEGKTLTMSRGSFDLDGERLHRAVAHFLAARTFDTDADNVELSDGVFCNLAVAEWAFKAWVKAPYRPSRIEIIGREWYRRGPGGMYCTAEIIVDDKPLHKTPVNGGHGAFTVQIAGNWLRDNGYMPESLPLERLWQYCERMKITLKTSCIEVTRERDL